MIMEGGMRYFFVSYRFWLSNGSEGAADSTFMSEGFPSKYDLIKELKSDKAFSGECVDSIIFTNIVELSKEDYESWLA